MNANDPLVCPRCQLPLKQVKTPHGVFWGCDNCGGRAITVELLRHTFTPESINPLWLHAIRGEGGNGGPCPMCRHPMIQVALSDRAEVNVDVCQHCHFVWFDAHEVDSLTPKSFESVEPEEASREARKRIAEQKIKAFADRVDRYQLTRTPVSEAWRAIADLFRGW